MPKIIGTDEHLKVFRVAQTWTLAAVEEGSDEPITEAGDGRETGELRQVWHLHEQLSHDSLYQVITQLHTLQACTNTTHIISLQLHFTVL